MLFTKILVATDGSEQATRALEAGADLAQRYGALLTVLHVVHLPAAALPAGAGEMTAAFDLDSAVMDRWIEDTKSAITRQVEAHMNRRHPNLPFTLLCEVGHPVDHIVRLAEEEKADLLVLGNRGLGGIKAFLMGSVSDRASHHVHCDVLIVK